MAKRVLFTVLAVVVLQYVIETTSLRTTQKSLHPEFSNSYEETFAMTVDYERMKSNVFNTKSDILVVTKPNGKVKVPFSSNEEGTTVVVLAEGITLTNVGGAPSTTIWAFAPLCFEKTYGNPGTASVKGPFSYRAKEINGDIGPKMYRGISTQVTPSMKCNTLYPHLPLKERVELCTLNQQRPGSGLHEWITVTETQEIPKASSRRTGELCPFVQSGDISETARPASYLLGKLSRKFEKESDRFTRDMLEAGADVYHTAEVYRAEGQTT
ncbi:hypothetical protein TGPRC2_209705 [Toxoplasma gondii TgCatPRC2]|uniref:Transmembrane protein n=1 Tax=Toxoplasma gondii TgCatPRC2 TaxID=1130821 RepID=A0A151HH23_TOXGO|nr:hypothetical protein TGPRC2_209705 [Toxoplasma gondii TgCatPRC2]